MTTFIGLYLTLNLNMHSSSTMQRSFKFKSKLNFYATKLSCCCKKMLNRKVKMISTFCTRSTCIANLNSIKLETILPERKTGKKDLQFLQSKVNWMIWWSFAIKVSWLRIIYHKLCSMGHQVFWWMIFSRISLTSSIRAFLHSFHTSCFK